jgi:hypothetical protein
MFNLQGTSPATKPLGEVTMFVRTVSALVLAAATFAPIASPAAALFGHGNGSYAKTKMVKMNLKNATSTPMEILIEDKPVTIAANGVYALEAPEGTRVFGTDKVVKVTVTRDLDGTTASFR